MSTEYRLAEGTAVVRRPTEVTLLALDGRTDPQPIVVRGTGLDISAALASWMSLEELVATVSSEHEDAARPEIEAGVREFIEGLCEFGVVDARCASGHTEHLDA